MAEPLVLRSVANGITTICINRPEIGNRVSDEMAAEIAQMVKTAALDSCAVLLRGAGKNFCLGREVFGKQKAGQEAYDLRAEVEPIFELYAALKNSPIPTIALVQGFAKGFGCALAAAADIRLAVDNARFQFPELAHNIMPTMAMSSMADRISIKSLMHLIYSTDEIDSARALEIGLISKSVPEIQIETAISALLANIQKAPLVAVKAVKEYARESQSMDANTSAIYAKNLHAVVNTSSKLLPHE